MPATPSTIRHSRTFVLLGALALAAVTPGPARAQTSGPAVSTVLALSGSRSQGGVVLGPGGQLYGASAVTVSGQTGGLIFRVAPDGSSVETLYQLGENDGINPQTGLLLVCPATCTSTNGVFYGTTHFGVRRTDVAPGTIFSVRADGTEFTTLHEFALSTASNQDSNPKNTDGAFPDSQLIEGSDGFLYGVTRSGGTNGTGTVFKISKDGTAFTTLHVFGAITSSATSGVTENADGAYPVASLIESNGWFYGSTTRGGANGRGVIFRLQFDGSGFQVLHVFPNLTTASGSTVAKNEDGAAPAAALLDGGALLYGVASAGGANGVGTIFSITPDGTVFTKLHDFDAPNGAGPSAPLIIGQDGKLYGVTTGGGTNSSGTTTTAGTIFSRDPNAPVNTGFTKVFSFSGSDGAGPNSAMIQLGSTVFIGTTASGGRCSEGTVFRLSTSGDTIDGITDCGSGGGGGGGGGATSPLALLLLLGAGWSVRPRRESQKR